MLNRDRFVVGDAVWEKVAPLLPGKASDPGATGKDNRLFLEAVLWRVRTGVPWRDRALAAAEAAMKERGRDGRDEELLRLRAKLGEVTMANELLEQKIAALEDGRPLGRRRARR